MHALCRRPDVEVEAILTHYRRRLTQHRHTNLHTGRGKRIRVTRPSPGCDRRGRPPPQVADRRGSEWDAFVDSQPAFVYSGYRAGIRQYFLRDQRRRANNAAKAQCQSLARRGFQVLN